MYVNDQPAADTQATQILHPGSRSLFVKWEQLRNELPCPTREEVEFDGMVDILPDLFIMERDHIRKGFRYRLAGTRVCELFRQNLTAVDALDGWDAFERDIISKHLAVAVLQYQPILMRMRLLTDNRQAVAAEMIGLPVRARSGVGVQVIGGIFPFQPARNIGHSAIVTRELLAIRAIWTEHSAALDQTKPVERNFRVITGGLSNV